MKRRSQFNKKTGAQLTAYIIAFCIMLIFCLSYLFSFLWAAFAATKTHAQIVMKPFAWHDKWLFSNYAQVFQRLEVNGVKAGGMLVNSLYFVLVGSLLTVLGPTLMAYAVTKFNFVGKKVLTAVNFIVIILPIVGALPSQYRMYTNLWLINSPAFIVTYVGCFGSNLLIIMSFFRNLSNEYRDAAMIDGAGEYRILFLIVLPLAAAPLMALYILAAVSIWNDYQTALLFLPKSPTLATGIFMFRGETTYGSQMEVLMAATVLSAIPPLILFIIFNKTMVTSLSIGGLKE